MSHRTPRYTPSSSMRRPRKNNSHKVVVWIVLLCFGVIFAGASSLICCGVLVNQQDEKTAAGEAHEASDHDAAARERTQSEQWHDRLVTHLKEGRREQAAAMFSQEFKDSEQGAEMLEAMLDVLTVGATREHELVMSSAKMDVVDGKIVETRSSYVHVVARQAHDFYKVGVLIELERDASGSLQAKDYTMTLLSLDQNGELVPHWGKSFSSIEAMGGFQGVRDAVSQLAAPMKSKTACVKYFAPYNATFIAHPRPAEVDRKNIEPVTAQMCEIISDELGRKGVKQTGVSVTSISGEAMAGIIKDWRAGTVVGLPVSITYEYERGGRTRTLEIFASATVDLDHPDRERAFTIDGYKLEVKEDGGSETFSFHARDVFRAYGVPYTPTR